MNQNGTARARRPQLADSIQRLDELLDGLADAIPGAVADSVREVLAAVLPEVVRAAIEHSTGELARTLAAAAPSAPAAATPSPSVPAARPATWADRLGDGLRSACAAVRSRLRRARSSVRSILTLAAALVRASPRSAAAAAILGTAAGVGGYHMGATCAAIMAGMGVGLLIFAGVLLAPIAGLLAPSHDT